MNLNIFKKQIKQAGAELCQAQFNLGLAKTAIPDVGPSGVRALPLAAVTNEGGHYFRYWSERSACASGQHSGGHYFGPSGAVQTVSDSRRPLF